MTIYEYIIKNYTVEDMARLFTIILDEYSKNLLKQFRMASYGLVDVNLVTLPIISYYNHLEYLNSEIKEDEN